MASNRLRVLLLSFVCCCVAPAYAGAPKAPRPFAVDLNAHTARLVTSRGAICSAAVVSTRLAWTARHCRDDGGMILMLGGQRSEVQTVLLEDPDSDAILLLLEDPLRVSEVRTASIVMFETLFVSGFGCDTQHIEARTRVVVPLTGNQDQVAVAGELCHGDSGGPVYNMRGEIVGVASAVSQWAPKSYAYIAPVDGAL